MKKLALTMLAVAFLVSVSVAKDKAPKSEKISGWVSDEKCGAKGANATHADCTKKCEDAGQKLVVVSDKGHKIYNVDNQDALKGHEGHHVRVTASDNNGTLHVNNVDMMKDQGSSDKKKEKDTSAKEHGK